MAFVSNSMVQPGGDYLLDLLKQKGSILLCRNLQ